MIVEYVLGARSVDAETRYLRIHISTAKPRSAARLRILASKFQLGLAYKFSKASSRVSDV